MRTTSRGGGEKKDENIEYKEDNNGADVASGVYVARLIDADGTTARAMTLLR